MEYTSSRLSSEIHFTGSTIDINYNDIKNTDIYDLLVKFIAEDTIGGTLEQRRSYINHPDHVALITAKYGSLFKDLGFSEADELFLSDYHLSEKILSFNCYSMMEMSCFPVEIIDGSKLIFNHNEYWILSPIGYPPYVYTQDPYQIEQSDRSEWCISVAPKIVRTNKKQSEIE